jgi:hypothetical protein
MTSLPVWSVVKNSYGYVGNRWKEFAPPVVLVFLVDILSRRNGFVALGMPEDAAWIISRVISILTDASLMVGLQRLILLHEDRRGIALFRWDRNFLRYLAALLLFLGCFVVPWLVATQLLIIIRDPSLHTFLKLCFVILGFVLSLAPFILPVRLSLSLPASAIGAPHPYSRSWDATRGNWFRLCAVWVLTALPFFILEAIVWTYQFKAMLAATGDVASIFADWSILSALGTALGAMYLPVSAVMQSLCYDILVRGGSVDETPSAVPTSS